MFFRMIKGTFLRQWKKMAMIALTIALGASLATAMISVVLDVGDKINQELKTYGANITVVPKQSSVVSDLYDLEDGQEDISGGYLLEEELPNIKTIFWAFNIVDYAPFLRANVSLDDGSELTAVGSWFNHHLELPTGETLDAGINNLRSWWDIVDGEWLNEGTNYDSDVVMLGTNVAQAQNLKVGDTINVQGEYANLSAKVVGIYDAGGEEDNQIYMPLSQVQRLSNTEGKVQSIEVSALTTPDNELAARAAKNPKSLTAAQYEIWYCTAYVSSICYQITEVISDSVANPVRQVAESEGTILDKTQLLMVLITVLSLLGSALGISNLVTASVMERSQEIGLMKAIGAYNKPITRLVLTEIMLATLIGGAIGLVVGYGFAQIIGQSVFGSAITMRGMVIPLVAVLVIIVTLLGSVPAIRMLLRLEPAEVLHGGH